MSRKLDTLGQIERLQKKHHALKAQVRQLDSRLSLSAAEQVHVSALKRQKLHAKDQINGLRRSLPPGAALAIARMR